MRHGQYELSEIKATRCLYIIRIGREDRDNDLVPLQMSLIATNVMMVGTAFF
jgi:hypothetical protein